MARVLVVDDEPLLRLLLRMVLENAGHEVREASDGMAALIAINDWSPTVVITELTMPTINGEDVVRTIRSQPATADITIIATSSRIPGNIDIDAAFSKPYEASKIAEFVSSVSEGNR